MCRASRPVRIFAVLLTLGRGWGLFVPVAVDSGLRIGPGSTHCRLLLGIGRVPVAAAGMEDRHTRAAGAAAPQGFPMSPVRDWIRQSLSMYLPWTGDRPVMYPPYTCTGDMPGSPGREVRLCCCERGARPCTAP